MADTAAPFATTRALALQAAGRATYAEGRPAAPWLNPVVRSYIPADTPVGSPLLRVVCEEFTRGYQAARDEHLDRLLGLDCTNCLGCDDCID